MGHIHKVSTVGKTTASAPVENLPAQKSARLDIRGKAELVNQAVAQSDVLLELIKNHLDYREHRSGEDFTGGRADTFNSGLSLLIDNTRERFKKAAAEIMTAAYSKTPEVAS